MERFLEVAKTVRIAALLLLCLPTAAAQLSHWGEVTTAELQLYNQGKYAEALPLAQQALRIAETSYGPQDRRVPTSLNNLAAVLKELNRYTDAEPLYQRAAALNEKILGPAHPEVAKSMNNLAGLYAMMGRFNEAKDLYTRAIAIQEKNGGPNDPSVANTSGNLGVLYQERGMYAEAEPLLQHALSIDMKARDPDSASVATDLNNLAALYDSQGKYAQAESLYLRAVAIHVKLLGNEHPTVAVDLNNLAVLYAVEGKYPLAEATYRRALAIHEKALGPESPEAARDMGNLAGLFVQLGRFNEAEALYHRAFNIEVAKLGPEHPLVATTLDNLGKLHHAQGHYGAAEAAYERALAIEEKALGPANPKLAITSQNLAVLRVDQGRMFDAVHFYARAVAIIDKSLGPDHPDMAIPLTNLGRFLLEHPDVDPAAFRNAPTFLQHALAINEKVLGPNHPTVAQNIQNLALAYEMSGRLVEAERLYRRAVDIDEKALGPNHSGMGTALGNLGELYLKEGKYAEAEQPLRRAVDVLEKSFGPDHPATCSAFRALAMVYFGWNRPELAAPYFDRDLAGLAQQVASTGSYMSERNRLFFWNSVISAFWVYFSFSTANRDRDPAIAGKMYDVLLWEKGLVASSSAALRARILTAGDRDAQALFEKLSAKKAKVASLASEPQSDPASLDKTVSQLIRESNEIEKELAARFPALTGQKMLAQATWKDVQKALKPGEAAVEFARFRAHSGKAWTSTEAYVALTVTPDSAPKLVLLGDARKLETATLAGYRATVARTRGFRAAPSNGAAEPAASSDAYDAFWKPLETTLGQAKRIYVSPDGVLDQVPIGLFSDSAGKMLIEKYDLRLVNSTKDLLRAHVSAPVKTAVLVGNPAFDLTAEQQRAALARLSSAASRQAAAPHAPASSSETRGGKLQPLPSTQIEVDAITKMLTAAGWRAQSYTGDLALKEVVERQRAPRLMHLATHGFFLSDEEMNLSHDASPRRGDPMLRSGLFFAGANRTQSSAPAGAGLDNGVLTASEAAQLDLQGTELVVLSACETALGEGRNGEGVYGLRRGLQEAGAEAVLMSMWSVPDQETEELMSLFYRKWLSGLDKQEALRQAQLEERETVRQRHGKDLPYYWGAFVLVGR